ncbi:MAG: prepilin-type N-terminal cleavage/methylation domain-containing protein [Alphaproteobacteria bacterium]|nr:prepilin-type N-terminal cleavage/methylation domain-containing protein [Alphaproteobacteria bacterium]
MLIYSITANTTKITFGFRKAFSLIEISVVILIIGILIAGISQGIDLYNDFNLTKARNITKNSRVGRFQISNYGLKQRLKRVLNLQKGVITH